MVRVRGARAPAPDDERQRRAALVRVAAHRARGRAPRAAPGGLKAFETKVRERAQTDAVHVDSIHDVARIIKVIGTVSHKGDGQGDRPHRVSAALSGFDRVEDDRLLARLDVEPEPTLPVAAPRVSLPVVGNVPRPAPRRRSARRGRSTTGSTRSRCAVHPAPLGPRRRGPQRRHLRHGALLRAQGPRPRRDHRADPRVGSTVAGMGKLRGRDGVRYVAKAHEKVLATARADGSIAPPCHSLQKIGFCKVNVEPTGALRSLRRRLRHREGDRGRARRHARARAGVPAQAHPRRHRAPRPVGAVEVPRRRREALRAEGQGPAQGGRQAATTPSREDGEGTDPRAATRTWRARSSRTRPATTA